MKKVQTQKIDSWAIRFANFIFKYGTVRVSSIFVAVALIFASAGSALFRYTVQGSVHLIDFVGVVLLILLSAPWVIMVFSELVRQLERSRKHLADVISQLESLRNQDGELTHKLQLEIEERVKTEKHLQSYSVLLRSIIDASPDMIYFRNEEGRFSGCNKVAERLVGKTEQELIDLSPFDVYEEDFANKVIETDKVVLETNRRVTEEMWLTFPDGKKAFYEFQKLPFFDYKGKRLGLLAFGRDLTEWKTAEDKLAKASKDKTRFISTISHELRTPLNGIVGLSRMIRDTQLSDEQRKWVNTIYTSAVTLGNIFNDIIDLDKLERARLELVKESVNTKDFLGELESIMELLASEKGLKFTLNIVGDIPTYIDADATRLRQVLWNLLSNGMKFTPEGGVSLTVEATSSDNCMNRLKFKVEDTGIGIPAHELKKIFAMYYRVQRDDHQIAVGTGIGLSISSRLIESMGGKIDVTSKVGSGSCFTIDVPFVIPQMPVKPVIAKVSGLNLLLVEDIELNVMVAQALLEKLGHSVDVAMTGQEAIDKIRTNSYDLILLDIQLPDMTGFDVAETVMEEDLVAGTPLVALTANVIKTREEYLNNGMDDVIAKPIKKSRVIEVFNQFFGSEEEVEAEINHQPELDENVLDTELLLTYLDTIGKDIFSNSINMLVEKMPTYLDELDATLAANEKDGICSQAHKIKGAAASVGLSRVQQIANEIQQGDHPAWWENLQDWVSDLKQSFAKDIEVLHEWMDKQP